MEKFLHLEEVADLAEFVESAGIPDAVVSEWNEMISWLSQACRTMYVSEKDFFELLKKTSLAFEAIAKERDANNETVQ